MDAALLDYVPAALPAPLTPVRTAGSSTITPLLNRWSESIRRIHPGLEVQVAGGGTGAGFAALLAGSADLAAMSRPATEPELAAFAKKFGAPPTAVVVGVDAIAIYVHKNNPLPRLSMKQIDALFGAEHRRGGAPVRAWSDLGVAGALAGQAVAMRGPARTHGLYGLFRDEVLQGGPYRLEMTSEIVASNIVQSVGADEAGVGFASRYFQSKRTRMVPVSETDDGPAVLPTQATSLDDSYPLARKLFIYVNRTGKNVLSPSSTALLRYICSRQGQQDAMGEGNYPLDAATVQKECTGRL